jgi:uncharacterized membrane protein YvbJ
MKYCYNCKRYRADTSAFCTQCGSSFDVKFCPRLHRNSTRAEYCQVCGSSDLSTPHAVPKSDRIVLALLVVATLGTVVALVTVLVSLRTYNAVPSSKVLTVMVAASVVAVAVGRLKSRP